MWRESVLNASQGSQLHIEASLAPPSLLPMKLLGHEASAPSGEPPAFKTRTCVCSSSLFSVHRSISLVLVQSVEDESPENLLLPLALISCLSAMQRMIISALKSVRIASWES